MWNGVDVPSVDTDRNSPAGLSTRLTSSAKIGTFTCTTRSKLSSGQGREEASPTRKLTRAEGSRPSLLAARRIISGERSMPRIPAVGYSRARKSVVSPVPQPRSSTLSGRTSTDPRPMARVSRCSNPPAPVRESQEAAAESKNDSTGRLITGQVCGLRATARHTACPSRRMRREGRWSSDPTGRSLQRLWRQVDGPGHRLR